MKLAVFDFDNTLVEGETIDSLAKEAGCYEEVCAITSSAMSGKRDFFVSLQKRAALLKGLSVAKARKVFSSLELIDGAIETVEGLKQRGYCVFCLSGGFEEGVEHINKTLKLDGYFANFLHTENSILTGQVGGSVMFDDSKRTLILKLQKILGISQADTICIGDGANDLAMFSVSGKKIAFCAKEVLREAADIQIDTRDLRLVLECLD